MNKSWYASSYTTVLSVPTERVVAAVMGSGPVGSDLTGGPAPVRLIESTTYPTHPDTLKLPKSSLKAS